MSRAWNLTRMDVDYRHHAFSSGLKAMGFDVRGGQPVDPKPGEVILLWNRYASYHGIACAAEKAGATVLIAENGYLGPQGISPHSMHPREWYALGRGYHNDSSAVRPGGPERFAALQVELKPWRQHGSHFLLAPNRLFGTPGRIMPVEWCSQTRRRLKDLSGRESRVRPHPGNEQARIPLADDLRNAWACVVWNSSAGVQSLIAGIPVICCAPNWILKPAGLPLDAHGMRELDRLHDEPAHADAMRLAALQHMANSQFHVDEIASGEAFRWVLGK